MKAFWWFEKDKVAGMARPGFNTCRWFDLPFDEAIVMGWLGQFSSGIIPLSSFHEHVETYAPKAAYFYNLNEGQKLRYFEDFKNTEAISGILDRLSERSQFIGKAVVADDHLHFEIHEKQLLSEIEFLKGQRIDQVVSLTEKHHGKDYLSPYFDLHHISIIDMGAPTVAQAQELKKILEQAEQKEEKIAVHCLAGIGRTSTLLMAAQMLRGHKMQDLLEHLSKQNPAYAFVGAQAEFIRKLNSELQETGSSTN